MLDYALRRLLQFIPTILAITLILFFLLNVLPGDAALMAGGDKREVDSQVIERMKKEWGLDKPVYLRYLIYLQDLAHGDMGLSFLRREKVSPCCRTDLAHPKTFHCRHAYRRLRRDTSWILFGFKARGLA
jgi:peptide/nickel transport system permease protein